MMLSRCVALPTVVFAMPETWGIGCFAATSALSDNISHCWMASVTLRAKVCLVTVSDAAKPVLWIYSTQSTLGKQITRSTPCF